MFFIKPSSKGWSRSRYFLPGDGAEKKYEEPEPRKNGSARLRNTDSSASGVGFSLTPEIVYIITGFDLVRTVRLA